MRSRQHRCRWRSALPAVCIWIRAWFWLVPRVHNNNNNSETPVAACLWLILLFSPVPHSCSQEDESKAVQMMPATGGRFEAVHTLVHGMYHYIFLVRAKDGSAKWRHSSMQRSTRIASGRSVNYVLVPAEVAPASFDNEALTLQTPLLGQTAEPEQKGGGCGCCVVQ